MGSEMCIRVRHYPPHIIHSSGRRLRGSGRRPGGAALRELSESSQSAPAEPSESSARALGGSGSRPGGAARPLRGLPRTLRGGGSGSRPGGPGGAEIAQKCTFGPKVTRNGGGIDAHRLLYTAPARITSFWQKSVKKCILMELC